MGAFDLIRKGVKGVKNAPFFSKVDEVLESLPRNKGTGDEFLREIEKAKGVKPAEIQDRGIAKALKNKPKMTKAEVQKIFESNPPPRLQEKVLSGEMPDYDEFIDKAAQERYGVDYYELRSDERAKIGKMYDELQTTQYEQYKTPGGENYREILLKLPKRGLTKMEQDELMLYEADLRRSGGQATPERMARYQELKAKEPDNAKNYTSGHYKEDPNLLAHIRVQDFQTPTRGFAVVNPRNGLRGDVFPTIEQAEAVLARYPEDVRSKLQIVEATGKPKKVLLVDEIQSDWHQAGRKSGYGTQLRDGWRMQPLENGEIAVYGPDMQAPYGVTQGGAANAQSEALKIADTYGGVKTSTVPDAPFKKNWHELAMKRVLDYAAENGYDTVAITPGAEQAKRYDLSQHIDLVKYDPETQNFFAKDKEGRVVHRGHVPPEELPNYVGQDLAGKIAAGGEFSGLDIQSGGEGMKGFYDKILPDYLNNFGKPYGSSVGQIQLPIGSEMSRGASGADMIPTYTPTMQSFHSFNITPQLRDEVKNKGLPLYSKMGMGPEGLAAGTGAATIGSQMFDENNEQQVQNPVHFTENPDAMLLELMQRN
jgi:hypothetical protein